MTSVADDVTANLKESAYVAVGLGVLAAQRVRTGARQLAETLSTIQPDLAARGRQHGPDPQAIRAQLHHLVRQVDQQVKPWRRQVDGALDVLQGRLDGPAAQAFGLTRIAARQSERWLRHRLDL